MDKEELKTDFFTPEEKKIFSTKYKLLLSDLYCCLEKEDLR